MSVGAIVTSGFVANHPPALVTCPRAAERLGFRTHVEEVGPSEWVLSFWK